MTFADLLLSPPELATLRGLWLVLPPDVAASALAKQELYGDPAHRIAPIAGPDGRFALCADLLTEIAPGGLHAVLFARLDAGKFAAVEVIDTAALRAAGWFNSAGNSL
jgi:hypothetical protein